MSISFIGSVKGEVTLSPNVFNIELKKALIHQVLQSELENNHIGTKKQKTRSEVSGGGSKPRRQKGGGCSRMGTIRSPILRGGGRAFAARVNHRSHKINRKMHQVAMRSTLSQLHREDRISVISNFDLKEPKTKSLVALLSELGMSSDLLIVVDSVNPNLYLSARNIIKVDVLTVDQLTIADLISRDKIIFTSAAIKCCEEKFS